MSWNSCYLTVENPDILLEVNLCFFLSFLYVGHCLESSMVGKKVSEDVVFLFSLCYNEGIAYNASQSTVNLHADLLFEKAYTCIKKLN